MASAIIVIDSARPTWRTVPASTRAWNSSRRQAGADLLLERQPPDPGVLDAVDVHRLHRLADAGQHDRQGVHREAGVDAGAEDGDLALLRQLVDRAREARRRARVGYASSSVVETIGTRRFTMAATCGQHFLAIDELVHRMATSGLVAGSRRRASSDTFTRSLRPSSATSPRSRPDLARIDVDAGDDSETWTRGHLPEDGGANGAQSEMRDANGHENESPG